MDPLLDLQCLLAQVLCALAGRGFVAVFDNDVNFNFLPLLLYNLVLFADFLFLVDKDFVGVLELGEAIFGLK